MKLLFELNEDSKKINLKSYMEGEDYLYVELNSEFFNIKRKIFVYSDAFEFINLLKFIRLNWHGWEGKKNFISVEKDFSLVIWHDQKSNFVFELSLMIEKCDVTYNLNIVFSCSVNSLFLYV